MRATNRDKWTAFVLSLAVPGAGQMFAGSGTFVQGVTLNTAGRIPWHTMPGERQLSPFSVHLVLKDKKLYAASGAFAGSLLEGAFQFLVGGLAVLLHQQQA